MDLEFAGKTVVVTGGGSNIGRAIALAFGREGARVAIAEIDLGQGQKVAREIEDAGGHATAIETDVSSWDSVTAMVQHVEREVGPIEALVNNVGWTQELAFLDPDARTQWEREVQVNFWGTINCTRAALDGMVERQRGSIVSMGSDAGRMGEFRQGVYAACKGGVIALSKSVAREVGRFGIRVNVVCPGTTMPDSEDEAGDSSMWRGDFGRWNTPEMRERIAKLYPLRRIGRPDDIADTVVFLSSARASFITGQTLSVSGGYTMM